MSASQRRLRPGRTRQVTNSAVSATTSSYTSQCVYDFVPADADLVLVEFSVNDWEVGDASSTWMNNNQRCAGRTSQWLGTCYSAVGPWEVTSTVSRRFGSVYQAMEGLQSKRWSPPSAGMTDA